MFNLFVPLPAWILYKNIYCTTYFGRFGMMNTNFWKSLVCHISSGVYPLRILEWRFIAYLLVARHGSSNGSGEFLARISYLVS